MSERTEAMYFGGPPPCLLGLYHAPPGRTSKRLGVVVCGPVGQESIRAHRTLRKLAVEIADAGFPTLRFDYYGVGDSIGDDNDCTLQRMQADVGKAIDLLVESGEVSKVTLIGFRLGALPAAAVSRDPRVVACALWNPIVSGRTYLDELRELHLRELAHLPATHCGDGSHFEALGFSFGPTLIGELVEFDLTRIPPPNTRVLVVENEQVSGGLVSSWTSAGVPVEHCLLHEPRFWVHVSAAAEKVYVPFDSIRRLRVWLESIANA